MDFQVNKKWKVMFFSVKGETVPDYVEVVVANTETEAAEVAVKMLKDRISRWETVTVIPLD